jgi:acyl-CoA synthetase (AMP-forming)/AMP-acid ligase II
LTETSIVVTFTSPHDIFLGSSGSLLPQIEMRLVDSEGKDVEGYDQRGEVLLKGPNNISGYLDDDNAYTLIDSDGWLHTGDVGLVRVHSEAQTEHLFIVDRMKDMIKVNVSSISLFFLPTADLIQGIQVAPVDIEARLLTHPGVEDAAVIGIPDETAGERPQAYVVRSPKGKAFDSEKDLRLSINKEIEAALNSTHWLGNRIVFIDEIPRNLSGKVLKEVLKERARNSG